MLAIPWAVQEPTTVEVVGESWWQNLIGPALVAVAAILAAALAAYVAIRNHRRQLEHDWAERDREHARASIRAAARTIAEILEPLTAHELAVRADDKATKDMEALQDSGNEQAKEQASEKQSQSGKRARETREIAEAFVIKMMVDSISLRISFGANSPVFKNYRELSLTFNRRFEACAPTDEDRAKREAEEEGESADTTHVALVAFQEACENWSVQEPPARQPGWFTRRTQQRSR